MDKKRRRKILGILTGILCIWCAIPESLLAQCTDTPVEEAVRNGDFEAGYLTKSGNSHVFTPDGPLDFQSELTSGNNFTGNNCIFSIANQYSVARREDLTCTASDGQTYFGTDYINVEFSDRTPGMNGEGFALIVDFEGFGGGSSYGAPGLPAAWRQEVDIYPNQRYTFSAWFANYNRDAGTPAYNNPELIFVVIPIDGGGDLVMAERDVIGSATPNGQMNWEQFSGDWIPANNYDRVALFIEMEEAALLNANDIVIDDISFINGCSNLVSLPPSLIPDLGPDFSICETDGTAELDANVATGGTTQFWWFSGDGQPQTTEVSGSATENTFTITGPGTYRVCVQSASFPAGCSASSTIVVNDVMPPVTLEDQVVCESPEVTLEASLTGTGLSYDWYLRPGGVPNPDSPQLTTDVEGTYGVAVTSVIPECGTVFSNDAEVTVNIASPTVNGFDCSDIPGIFDVAATGGAGSGYAWWDAPTGGNQLDAGTPASIEITEAPTTVYVENFTASTAGTPRTAATGNSGGAPTFAETNFTAQEDFTLVSVWVRDVAGCAGTFTLSLDENGGATGLSVTPPCSGAWQEVTLNWPITAGNNYRINATGAWFAVHAGYTPTTYADAVTINTASSGGSGAAVEWSIKLGSPCIRTPLVLDCPLPVYFIRIDAERTGFGTQVSWQAIEDSDPSPYTIERSVDPAGGFVPIATVPAGKGSYTYEDRDILFDGAVYYRIAKRQEEGNIVYSPVASTTVRYRAVAVYPNPFQGSTTLQLDADPDLEFDVRVTSLSGRVWAVHTLSGNSILHIGHDLAPGSYLLYIAGKDGYREVKKIVKLE